MKSINKYLLIASLLFTSLFISCDKFLDVNEDPNNPLTATPQLIFPAGVKSTSSIIGGYWQILGGIWAQHWTSQPNAPQYQLIESYGITAGSVYVDSYTWGSLYSGALMDYEQIRKDAGESQNWNYYLMATVMQCYTYQVIADLYDQIPFSEALNKVPGKYDDGQAVYDGLISRLDDALSKDLSATTSQKPSNDDVVFNGNMNRWIEFANTLKLKIYLRQVYARPEVSKAGIEALYASNAPFLSTDAAFTSFSTEKYKENPVFAIEWRNGSTNLVASRTLLDYLGARDLRRDYIYKPAPAGHKGMIQGDYRNADLQNDKFSQCIVTAKQPVQFISKIESMFLQAEACARGYGTADAKTLYDAAVDADFKRLDVRDVDLNPVGGISITKPFAYAEYPNGSFEENLQAIIMQKWIAFANLNGLEAFFEFNRTGYPKVADIQPYDTNFNPAAYNGGEFLVSVNGVLPGPVYFPKRLMFPSSEINKNPNTPASKTLDKKVWWDKK